MSRVLLVNPPFYRLWGSHYNGMMLGIASLCASLRAVGHDAWMLNADYEPHDNYPTTRQIHGNATGQSGWTPPIGELALQTANAILAFNPDVVGYTVFSANFGAVAHIAHLVERGSSKWVRQVIGGPHATVDRHAARRVPELDCLFTGEAEATLRAYLNGRNPNGKVGRIEDLDSLPPIDRTHWVGFDGLQIPDHEYINTRYIATARGCPYACKFCSAPRLWGRRVTFRGTQSVIDEFRLLNAVEDPRNAIHVVDDTFVTKKSRALNIMGRLVSEGLTAPWKCEARADAIDDEIADALAASGCIRAKIGVESGSPRILERMGKSETKDDIRRGTEILKSRGIAVTGYLIVGVPGETDDDLRQTIDFARELDLDTYSLNFFAPYPGSALHDASRAQWEHIIDDDPWSLFGQSRLSEASAGFSESLLEEYWGLSK